MPKNFFFEMTYDKFKKIADYRKAAVATLKYIATRENQQGEEMSRTLFGKERTYRLVLLCQILSEHSSLNCSVVIHHNTAW